MKAKQTDNGLEREEVIGFFEAELSDEVEAFESAYPDRYRLPVPITAFESYNNAIYRELVEKPSDDLPVINSVLRFSDAHSAAHLPGAYVVPYFDNRVDPAFPGDIPARKVGTITPLVFQVRNPEEQRKRPFITVYRCNACDGITEIEAFIDPADEPFECSDCGRVNVDYNIDSELSYFIPAQDFEALNTADVMKNLSDPRLIPAKVVGHTTTKIEADAWYYGTALIGATREGKGQFSLTSTVLHAEEITPDEVRHWLPETRNTIREYSHEEILFGDTHDLELEEGLWGFAEHVDRVFNAYEPSAMSEDDLRMKVLLPFVDLLGWDVFTDEVRLEYGGDIDNKMGQIDIALLPGGVTTTVAVEAKRPDAHVARKAKQQLQEYMHHSRIEWGVLSNGYEFELIHRDQTCHTVFSATYDDLPQRAEKLAAIQRIQFK